MTLATITSKGQVTVPKELRDNLGLNAGDKIDFHMNDDGTITIRPCNKTIGQVRGIIKTNVKLTVEEMDLAIAELHKVDG